jgi:hypothetical protein
MKEAEYLRVRSAINDKINHISSRCWSAQTEQLSIRKELSVIPPLSIDNDGKSQLSTFSPAVLVYDMR